MGRARGGCGEACSGSSWTTPPEDMTGEEVRAAGGLSDGDTLGVAGPAGADGVGVANTML